MSRSRCGNSVGLNAGRVACSVWNFQLQVRTARLGLPMALSRDGRAEVEITVRGRARWSCAPPESRPFGNVGRGPGKGWPLHNWRMRREHRS